jgi:hypothetical protein
MEVKGGFEVEGTFARFHLVDGFAPCEHNTSMPRGGVL